MKLEFPKIPDAAYDVRWNNNRGTQDVKMLRITMDKIVEFQDELENDFPPPWNLDILPTNRLLITNSVGEQLVAYMVDPIADGRLMVDDYCPELGIDTFTEIGDQ